MTVVCFKKVDFTSLGNYLHRNAWKVIIIRGRNTSFIKNLCKTFTIQFCLNKHQEPAEAWFCVGTGSLLIIMYFLPLVMVRRLESDYVFLITMLGDVICCFKIYKCKIYLPETLTYYAIFCCILLNKLLYQN